MLPILKVLTVSSYCFLLETNDVMYWSQVKQMFSYISLLYWFFGKIQHIGKHTNTRTKLFVDKHYMNWIVALFENRNFVAPTYHYAGGNDVATHKGWIENSKRQ